MKIKRYLDWVNEALKPSQFREYVKEFDRERYKDIFMKHHDEHDRNFFRIYLNLESEKSETQKEIEELFSQNDIEIIDYIEGKAKFKSAKNISRIGQLLQRLERNHPDKEKIKSLMKRFVEDPQRKAGQNLMVCISRHPYDIAGSDTDRSWSNCLTIGDEDSRRYAKYMESLKKSLLNVDFDKLRFDISEELDNHPEIEEVDVDEYHGDIRDTILEQLKKFEIDFDEKYMFRYEDEDGFVETEDILFNELCDKWNSIIDSIMKITEFVISGGNVKYIKCHVTGGVLMSYLINKNDKNINNPVANLDIKPYFNIFKEDDIFLKSDDKMYGQGTPSFKKRVDEWISEVNGSDKNGIYYLGESLYNDNLQDRCIYVENGILIKELSPKLYSLVINQYKNKISTIQSDSEAVIFIQSMIKMTKDNPLSTDFKMDIKNETPSKWKDYFKKNFKSKIPRRFGWF